MELLGCSKNFLRLSGNGKTFNLKTAQAGSEIDYGDSQKTEDELERKGSECFASRKGISKLAVAHR